MDKQQKKKVGRPPGSKNKNPDAVRILLENWTVDNFAKFRRDYEKIDDPVERVKIYEKIASRFIPRPVSREEIDAQREARQEFLERLFGAAKKED